MPNIDQTHKKVHQKVVIFLDQINETHIVNLLDLSVDADILKKTYNFLIFFMKYHIHSMSNIKGLNQIENIYNEL